MRYSFYINSKSALDKLRILFKRIRNSEDNQIIDNINELYIDSNLLFSNLNDDKVFVNIYKINKNINIIPHSQLLYYQFLEEDFNEDERSDQLQQKINYLNNFYEENEDNEEIYYNYSESSFLKYTSFYDEIIGKINTDKSISRSSILRFLDIELPQRIRLSKKIAPFIFLEAEPHRNIKNFDDYFETFDNLDETFDTFLIYTPLSYLRNFNTFNNKQSLSSFKNIILWLPDFNEISASVDQIKDLRNLLRNMHEINSNLAYLFGGMMIGKYFSDYIKEVICRKDIYPGYRIIPTKETFGRRKKNLFFPQFGRTTKLENIASPPYIQKFECNCLSCSDFHEAGIFNKAECLEGLEHSDTRKYYHNYHSFILKLESNEEIEQYPDLDLDNIKLGQRWRNALNE
ncbi:MAG: hypothetical protein ACFFDF_17860 [Candidatus Odinarchaeota archaeon]